MSSTVCNPCTRMRPLLACATTLTVGTIANLTTAIYVYIHDHTTGRLVRYSTTSSGAGVVSFDLSDGQVYAEDHDYELYITLASATNIEEKVSFTINAVAYDCVALDFKRVYDNDDVLVSAVQTLKAA